MPASSQKPVTRLDKFLEALPVVPLALEIARRTNSDSVTVESMLGTYINEARISFALVKNHLDQQTRMLEVGAGLCLLSLFLKQEGYSIVALEPALGGFGTFDVAKKVILEHFDDIELELLTCTAQELDPSQHGTFDLIFSNNVIEHIPDWKKALAAMLSVLTNHGRMLHSCPNYTVPYEPHYGIPVFRHFPKLSRYLFLPRDSDLGIWKSLNFICSRDINRFCNTHALRCQFEKALLYKALKRIGEDSVFRSRHTGFVANIAGLLHSTGLVHLFKYIPVALSTPMIVEITRMPDKGAG